jgi:uncharacterized glyoxalase superfamily protein PhnB
MAQKRWTGSRQPSASRSGACGPAQKWSAVPYIVDGVLVYVADVDAHFAQAKQRGAAILTDVETDQYGKRYRAEDLEGHRWMFMQRG